MAQDTQKIRVLIIDDHAVVRGGLQFFFARSRDIEVVGEAEDGERALLACQRLNPDVVLMDLVMPRMDGIEATRRIHAQFPDLPIIVLTSFEDQDLIQRAFQAGAMSYLLKDTPGKELGEAIRAAHAGRSTVAPSVTQKLIHAVAQPHMPGYDLTHRELDVLRCLCAGLSNAQIADRLTVSSNTVRHHVRNILSKLHVNNRTSAVAIALENNLVRESSD